MKQRSGFSETQEFQRRMTHERGLRAYINDLELETQEFQKAGFKTDQALALIQTGETSMKLPPDEKTAQEATEDREAFPTDAKRQTFTGTLVSVKTVMTDFGETVKMLVKEDRGFKLYGSLPADLHGVEAGAKIQFDAKPTVSRDDEFFGFFSRPTKAAEEV